MAKACAVCGSVKWHLGNISLPDGKLCAECLRKVPFCASPSEVLNPTVEGYLHVRTFMEENAALQDSFNKVAERYDKLCINSDGSLLGIDNSFSMKGNDIWPVFEIAKIKEWEYEAGKVETKLYIWMTDPDFQITLHFFDTSCVFYIADLMLKYAPHALCRNNGERPLFKAPVTLMPPQEDKRKAVMDGAVLEARAVLGIPPDTELTDAVLENYKNKALSGILSGSGISYEKVMQAYNALKK